MEFSTDLFVIAYNPFSQLKSELYLNINDQSLTFISDSVGKFPAKIYLPYLVYLQIYVKGLTSCQNCYLSSCFKLTVKVYFVFHVPAKLKCQKLGVFNQS